MADDEGEEGEGMAEEGLKEVPVALPVVFNLQKPGTLLMMLQVTLPHPGTPPRLVRKRAGYQCPRRFVFTPLVGRLLHSVHLHKTGRTFFVKPSSPSSPRVGEPNSPASCFSRRWQLWGRPPSHA